MAGLTTTFTTKLHLPKPISLNYPSANLFGICLNYHNCNPTLTISTSLVCTARYGGGGGGRGPPRGAPKVEEDEALNISSIRSDKVRLIDDKQNMVGVVSKFEAVKMAEDAGLNLVILSPEADPPVVKIMDYDKYRYEQQKKKKEQQKKSLASRMDLKELKMGYNIDVHDYSVRLRAAKKFLKDGDKVKIIVSLKGRENEFRNKAIELIKRFQEEVGELAVEENKNFRDRNIFIILVPNKAVVPKAEEQPKRKMATTTEVSTSVLRRPISEHTG
ncbi:hypothetical protein Leryth_017722 [Lithospermum erythrorhizon]|nr:hypothetical protein Leryth_017722 [Lithospermum erythrorhizon]